MDRWGHCDECSRWFYMPGETSMCPVCRRAAASVVDRDAEPAPAVETPSPSANGPRS